MKKHSLLTLLGLAIILFFVGYGAATFTHQSASASFTATYNERLTDSKGNVTEHRYIIAEKPGASVRINFASKPDGSECQARIVRTPASTIFVVDELKAKSTTYHPSTSPIVSQGSAQSAQNRFTAAGTALAFGYFANILIAEDKASRVERWIIPELNDLAVKDVRHWKDATGAIVSTTEQTVTQLSVGDPDPSLFVVPSDYTELPPSQIETALVLQVLQQPLSKLNPDVLQRSDDIYVKSQRYR